MNKLFYAAMTLAVLGLAAGANVAVAAQKNNGAANKYECFTDDGYGRKLPCSYSYQKRAAAAKNYDCFTDDGYGRRLPCSYNIKRR